MTAELDAALDVARVCALDPELANRAVETDEAWRRDVLGALDVLATELRYLRAGDVRQLLDDGGDR